MLFNMALQEISRGQCLYVYNFHQMVVVQTGTKSLVAFLLLSCYLETRHQGIE
jgi:hypothetical protein